MWIIYFKYLCSSVHNFLQLDLHFSLKPVLEIISYVYMKYYASSSCVLPLDKCTRVQSAPQWWEFEDFPDPGMINGGPVDSLVHVF